ncbi:uncharacterized protein LTHEOB_8869 [Neofusicoccum parvum]|nr:uncharacterized protein LTHEOB_8869 [Neofusicoccum parvum]
MTTASPPPAASPTPGTSASASASATPVHTYHCICTQLLLATTTPLPALPRRGTDNPDTALLDRAYILPLPTRPPTAGDGGSGDGEHYALTLNTQVDRKPRIVQREDGLEKRWVQRCARCRCAVGYQLDWAHFAEGEEGGEGRTGWRRDVVYLLPGALLSTEEMARGEGGEKVGGGKA